MLPDRNFASGEIGIWRSTSAKPAVATAIGQSLRPNAATAPGRASCRVIAVRVAWNESSRALYVELSQAEPLKSDKHKASARAIRVRFIAKGQSPQVERTQRPVLSMRAWWSRFLPYRDLLLASPGPSNRAGIRGLSRGTTAALRPSRENLWATTKESTDCRWCQGRGCSGGSPVRARYHVVSFRWGKSSFGTDTSRKLQIGCQPSPGR